MDKILIIQDSAAVNAVLKFRLEAGEFSVETVETGEEGIEKAKVCQYQLTFILGRHKDNWDILDIFLFP